VSTSSFQAQEIKSPAWARYYSRHGTSFAASAAPRIRGFYEESYRDRADRSLLDVCCGQGTLAEHFLEHGYRVTGIDLPEPMLAFARQNLREHPTPGGPGSSGPTRRALPSMSASALPPRRSTP
jgi:2-polyprenyl-3-methyl-5-hydroxy-6-metoxy-1,4-benzoquinol methylase